MIIVKETVPFQGATLIPLGDMHLGDTYFTKRSLEKLKGYIDWIKKHPDSRAFLTGDIFNVATRISKTSPYERGFVDDEVTYAVDLLEPIKHQIIGAISGNHEQRLLEFSNYSLIKELCYKLSDKQHKVVYCGDAALLFLKVGDVKKHISKTDRKKNKANGGNEYLYHTTTYAGYISHTTGGGSTVGGKMNRVDKLRQIVAGCDFYVGAHNHMEGAVKTKIYLPDTHKQQIKEVRQIDVDAGSFLEYGGYAERAELAPVDIGAPKIIFESKKRSIHISM